MLFRNKCAQFILCSNFVEILSNLCSKIIFLAFACIVQLSRVLDSTFLLRFHIRQRSRSPPKKWTHKYFPCRCMRYCLTRVPFTKVKSNINQDFMKLLPRMVHQAKMKKAFLLPCSRLILAHDFMKFTNEAKYASATRCTVAKLLLFLALLQSLRVFPQIHRRPHRVSRFTHSLWIRCTSEFFMSVRECGKIIL